MNYCNGCTSISIDRPHCTLRFEEQTKKGKSEHKSKMLIIVVLKQAVANHLLLLARLAVQSARCIYVYESKEGCTEFHIMNTPGAISLSDMNRNHDEKQNAYFEDKSCIYVDVCRMGCCCLLLYN